MRRTLLIILVIVCFIVMIKGIKDDEQEIRVRIIPNSNNQGDLENKQIVKDVIVSYLYNAYDEEYFVFTDNIEKGLEYLQVIVTDAIGDEVLISFGNHTLYNKTYNNTVVKNSTELTLLIVIGEGKGDNWWGTVYPDFLVINGSEVVKYESLFVKLFNKTSEDQDD